MPPNSKRLSTALFKEAMMKGKLLHSPFFMLRVVKSEGVSRFSVSVPKKVSKGAVGRNKIRRRVYSVLNALFPQIKEGMQGVFVVKPSIVQASFEEISSNMHEFFGKSGFLK